MAHDHNGRVGPPRCEECNAPLSSDERRPDSTSAGFFCLDCQLVLNPFPAIMMKIKRRRRLPLRSRVARGESFASRLTA